MNKKLRTNLIVLMILFIVIVLTILFMIIIRTHEKKALESKANEFGLIVTEHASNTIEKWVSDQVSLCTIIGGNGQIIDFLIDPTDIDKQSNAYQYLNHITQEIDGVNDFRINIFKEEFELISNRKKMFIKYGAVVLDSNDGISVGSSTIEDDYVRKMLYGYEHHISYINNNDSTLNDLIMISVPIIYEEELLGIASVTYIPEEIYHKTIGQIDISETSDLGLVDHDGNVMGSKFFTGINAFEKGGEYAHIVRQVQVGKTHFHAMLLNEHTHFNAKPVLLVSSGMYARWYAIFKQSYDEIASSTSALSNMLLMTGIVAALCLGTICNILIKASHKKAHTEGLLIAQKELNNQIIKRTSKLDDLSRRDSLTGAYNHKYIIDYLEDRLKIDHNVSLIMLDLDLFKNINDQYGHLIGDEVLKKVSEIIDMNIEDDQHFGRYGGEEFLIVLPVTSLQSAIVLGEKLRKKISSIQLSEMDLKVTASLGIVHCNNETVKENIKRVDEMLYRAKKNGRNRIEWEVN